MVIMNDTQRQGSCTENVIQLHDGVTLQPFPYQVSGRATMMCLNETTVCKPLNFREYYFYQSLPPDILQYTAQYKGIINVHIEENNDGTINLTALPLSRDESELEFDMKYCPSLTCTQKKPAAKSDSCKRLKIADGTEKRVTIKKIRLKRTGSLCIDRNEDSEKCTNFVEDDKLIYSTNLPRFNPWTLKVYKEGLKRHLHSKNKVVKKCILLENVTSRFKFPCILDLKMGTRIHGDFDDDEKRKRHLKKCAATTTQSVGVRLAGMQVYRHESETFLCRNKYFGRGLSVEGLKKTLKEFFFNGCRIRTDLLEPVIENLTSLMNSLNRLPSYRFYSSSLLIMYDGFEGKTLEEEPSKKELKKVEPGTQEDESESNAKHDVALDAIKVDVKMIDFAKSTHQYMDESVVHDGPDKGYIFGLENLVHVFREILDRESKLKKQ